MSSVLHCFRRLSGQTVGPWIRYSCITSQFNRSFSDKLQKPDADSKQVVGTESIEQVRVRRARAADVPRVLRFVREHARSAWPGLVPPPDGSHLLLCDYVARTLAQGHSMLAEQQESKRGWGAVRGLALSTAVCPWDAVMLERWARCIQCSRSRHLMHFTAHCLRAPALHDKYHVHKILQVSLMVPLDNPKTVGVVHVLAQNAIQRARDTGFPLIRFDVSNDTIAKSLEQMDLTKEWQIEYEAYPESVTSATSTETNKEGHKTEQMKTSKQDPSHFLAVYTSQVN